MAYNTKQLKILLHFFQSHHDEWLSAEEIAKGLGDTDISISTIYRKLSALEKAGQLRKSTHAASNTSYYQYIDADKCQSHLHLCCTSCGKTTHLSDDESKLLTGHILQNANFNVDNRNTILYGLCKKCNKKRSANEKM